MPMRRPHPQRSALTLQYPADYIRKINRGLVELGQFNVPAELSAAETIAVGSQGREEPVRRPHRRVRASLRARRGAARSCRIASTFPPVTTAASRIPLIVALHGLGANEDSFMDAYGKTVPTLAEQRGYIVVAPLGFRADGFYGFSLPSDASPNDRRRVELSEQDVMEVLKRARADYKIDDSRIYLMGHSMGAIGTWAIAAKHPTIWAALAPFSGLGNPSTIATSSTFLKSSCTAMPIQPSTSPDRGRWWPR